MQKTILKSFAVAVLMLAGSTAIHAEPFLYAAANGKLVKVDVGAGTATEVGAFGVPWAVAIAITPDGQAYTATPGWPPGAANGRLANVDIATGAATPYGATHEPEIFMALGSSQGGTTYGVNAGSGTDDQGSLYRFDRVTGAATKVGVSGGCGLIMDLASHPDGTLYGIDPSSLYRVDPQTGEATLVATTTHTMLMGLAIDDDGNFYISEIFPNAPLLKLDPSTGATTPVPGVSLNLPHGLEFIPTPHSGNLEIAFQKSPAAGGYWLGTVDTDSDGVADGEVTYHRVDAGTVHGKTLHFIGEYQIETPFYSFTALLNVVANLNNRSIRANGVITDGWLDGAQIHMDGNLVPTGSAGVFRLMVGSAD